MKWKDTRKNIDWFYVANAGFILFAGFLMDAGKDASLGEYLVVLFCKLLASMATVIGIMRATFEMMNVEKD